VEREEMMIILLNGSFGVGKTSTAQELEKRIENSMIYDPEEVGFMLKNIITNDIKFNHEKTDDFQDLDLWKVLVVKVASQLKKQYNKNLIIPMTIYKDDILNYVLLNMKSIDKVYNFCLIADIKTIHSRLEARGDKVGGWSFKKSEEAIFTFENKYYSSDEFDFIDTDELNIDGVVDYIVKRVSKN